MTIFSLTKSVYGLELVLMSEQTKIVIADDHPLFRGGLRQVIEAERSFTVVGEASDGETALRLICELIPDVAVLDINMPGHLAGLKSLAKCVTETCRVKQSC